MAPVAEPRVTPQVVEHPVLAPVSGATIVWSSPNARTWAPSKLAHAPPLLIPILLSKQSFLL